MHGSSPRVSHLIPGADLPPAPVLPSAELDGRHLRLADVAVATSVHQREQVHQRATARRRVGGQPEPVQQLLPASDRVRGRGRGGSKCRAQLAAPHTLCTALAPPCAVPSSDAKTHPQLPQVHPIWRDSAALTHSRPPLVAPLILHVLQIPRL